MRQPLLAARVSQVEHHTPVKDDFHQRGPISHGRLLRPAEASVRGGLCRALGARPLRACAAPRRRRPHPRQLIRAGRLSPKTIKSSSRASQRERSVRRAHVPLRRRITDPSSATSRGKDRNCRRSRNRATAARLPSEGQEVDCSRESVATVSKAPSSSGGSGRVAEDADPVWVKVIEPRIGVQAGRLVGEELAAPRGLQRCGASGSRSRRDTTAPRVTAGRGVQDIRVDGAGSVLASVRPRGARVTSRRRSPFRSPMALADDRSLADGEDLRRACERLGSHRGPQGVVTYCTIGNRASQVAFALTQDLGFPTSPSSTACGPDGTARRDTRSRLDRLRAPWKGTPACARGAAPRTAPPGARTLRRRRRP
jgi:hypothetical protein